MATATTTTRSNRTRNSNRRRTLPVDRQMPVFMVELTEKGGAVSCWPEVFHRFSKAKQQAKWWVDEPTLGAIASARVRRVAAVTFVD